jgi:hypothetical protein
MTPRAARTPFLLGLAILVFTLGAFALLRWQAPLIALGALGFPLLFVLYLRASDIAGAVPVLYRVATTTLGAGLGVGWALLATAIATRSYNLGLAEGNWRGHTILEGLTIPISGAILMLVPAAIIRLRYRSLKPLDGFVIGALGAIGFDAGTALTLLAPQFVTGATTDSQPVSELLAEAGIQGVAMPLTAAALGGLFGAALWFAVAADSAPDRRHRVTPLVWSVAVAVALYLGLGLLQVFPLADAAHFGLHMFIAILAVLASRIGLRAVLPPDTADGAAPLRQNPFRWLLLPLGVGMTVVSVAAFALSVITTPVIPRYVCPPDCGRPPLGEPVQINPWFRSTDNKFLVQYPRAGTAYTAIFDPNGVNVHFTAGDTGTLELFGVPAEGREAQRVAEDLIHKRYPDAVAEYEIPNALVGYEPGYGVVSDVYPQDPSGAYSRLRLLVMVAVENDYALVAAAIGPYHEFSRDFGNGHPSAVDFQLALDVGKYVNSFIWREPHSPH